MSAYVANSEIKFSRGGYRGKIFLGPLIDEPVSFPRPIRFEISHQHVRKFIECEKIQEPKIGGVVFFSSWRFSSLCFANLSLRCSVEKAETNGINSC